MANKHNNQHWIIKEDCNAYPELYLKGKRAKPNEVYYNLEKQKTFYHCTECNRGGCCMIEVW